MGFGNSLRSFPKQPEDALAFYRLNSMAFHHDELEQF
jgi:hypothetical protein